MLLHLRRAAPPGFIEPCLPSPAERPPSGPDWVHEIKHDGYRLMARRDPVGVRLLTRNGHDWSPRYPLIVEAVNRLKARSCLMSSRPSISSASIRTVQSLLARWLAPQPFEHRKPVLIAGDRLAIDHRRRARPPT